MHYYPVKHDSSVKVPYCFSKTKFLTAPSSTISTGCGFEIYPTPNRGLDKLYYAIRETEKLLSTLKNQ